MPIYSLLKSLGLATRYALSILCPADVFWWCCFFMSSGTSLKAEIHLLWVCNENCMLSWFKVHFILHNHFTQGVLNLLWLCPSPHSLKVLMWQPWLHAQHGQMLNQSSFERFIKGALSKTLTSSSSTTLDRFCGKQLFWMRNAQHFKTWSGAQGEWIDYRGLARAHVRAIRRKSSIDLRFCRRSTATDQHISRSMQLVQRIMRRSHTSCC